MTTDTKEISQEWLEIQKTVKQDFLNHVSKKEMAKIAQVFDLKVQGFSKKRLVSAPPPMLKQTITKFMDSLTDLRIFFRGFTGPFIEDMEAHEFSELILQASLEESMTDTQKMMIVAVLFPERYEDNRKRMIENVENGEDVFTGLQEFSLEEILKGHAQKHETTLPSLIDSFLEKHTIIEDLPEELDLVSFFEKEYEEDHETEALQIVSEYDLNGEDYSSEELLPLYKLALHELITLADRTITKANEEREGALHEKASAERKASRYYKRRDDLLRQLKEKEQDRQDGEKDQREERLELQRQNETLERELEKVRQEYKDAMKKKEDAEIDVFSELDDFLFITSERAERYDSFIPEKKLLTYNTDRSFSEQFKFIPENKLIFIDTNSLSSKAQLEVRKYLQQKQYSYKFVSGSPQSVFRKIIFYLEGDATYEAIN
ncbi:hypothetical protein [Pontibacillus salipaludis]|uniref:Uncharacterized protein n=1 Tax=Pontibacillus salipaludis TaxID=1697394 RepID=A0ABQ1Q5U3_9BACI|nr:hypothetical protein [Pontibacillus salipaludis]GGD13966.1 hypothetical protein GCM10011389_22020 [Pontibacillus salipaludis]